MINVLQASTDSVRRVVQVNEYTFLFHYQINYLIIINYAACDCNSIGAKDNNCDLITGQCNCHPNTYGRECDQCQPGYWNFPNCQMCKCNGHAQSCDPRTGECLSCQDFTVGPNCDR